MSSPVAAKTSQNAMTDEISPKSNHRKSIFRAFIKRRSSLTLSASSNDQNGFSPLATKTTKTSNFSRHGSLRREGSVKSGNVNGRKSLDASFIDQEDMSIYNSDEENNEMSEVPDGDNDTSETSSTYSNLQRTGSMTLIDKNVTLLDEKSSELLDSKLYELLKSADDSIEPSTVWEDFKHESLLVPKYLKPNRRNKTSPPVFKRLFLAQELNDESDSETEDINMDNHSLAFENRINEIQFQNKNKSGSSFNQQDQQLQQLQQLQQQQNQSKAQNPIVSGKMSKEIFVMQFSRDGKYLAVAGRDSVIKVWKVICSPLGRMEYNNFQDNYKNKNKNNNKHGEDVMYQNAPVFHQRPVRIFKGHSNSVLSIDWSKNNFLVSGSMDKTVKLWHVDRPTALATFQHEDFVTTVNFHPNDDRFFLSGSLDNQARIWSILERSVAYGRHLGDEMLITSSTFTPDGLYCVFGGFNGTVAVLETKGLHIVNKFDIKQKTLVPIGNTNGNKVTNIKAFKGSDDNNHTDYRIWSYLITTNDSRIRLINVKDKRLVTRFKGTTNTGSIEASLSEDHRYVLSGSEDHWVYLWENNNEIINRRMKGMVTDILNEGSHHLNELKHKHKKYYNFLLRNKLFNKFDKEFLHNEEMNLISNENSSYSSFHAHHSNVNAAIFAPNLTKKLLEVSDDLIFDLIKRARGCVNIKAFGKVHLPDEDSIDYGNEGFIIVTTDDYGLIRVFRHDPAYEIRNAIIDIYKRGGKDKDSDSVPCDVKDILNKTLPSNPKGLLSILPLSKVKTGQSKNKSDSQSSLSFVTKGRPSLDKENTTQSAPNLPKSINFQSSGGNRLQLKSVSAGVLSNNASLSIPSEVEFEQSNVSTFGNIMNSRMVPSLSPGAITPEKEQLQPFPSIELKNSRPVIPEIVSTPPTGSLGLQNVSSIPISISKSNDDSLKNLKIKRVNKE